MSIKITKAGIADTVQDAGRFGWQHLGINPTGAMDIIAMQVANALVGNDLNQAVIELHFPASTFLFEEDALIALSGAGFSATINQQQVNINKPIIIFKNSVLQFSSCKKGARCYLAISSGLKIETWLNGKSTNIKAKAGGVNGRFLKKDDCIEFQKQLHFKENKSLPWQADASSFYSAGNMIRAIKGNEFYLLKEESVDVLEESSFAITTKSDRMAYRINGIPLQLKEQKEMISSAVTRGTVQLLPDGHLIILMADHQTTGGYPRIAHIISADQPKLAQMKAGETMQLQFVSIEEAESLFIEQHQNIRQLQIACNLKLEDFLELTS